MRVSLDFDLGNPEDKLEYKLTDNAIRAHQTIERILNYISIYKREENKTESEREVYDEIERFCFRIITYNNIDLKTLEKLNKYKE